MRRWLKRVGIFTAAVVLLIVLAVLVEHVRGRWALYRRLKQLEARSEKLTLAAVEPNHPTPDQNCFADLGKLTNQLSSVARSIEGPPTLGYPKPGRAAVAWRLDDWSRDNQGTSDWNEIGAVLDGERNLLKQLHSALQKPAYDSGFDYQKGFVDFSIGPLASTKDMARILSIAALHDLHRNQLDQAFNHLHALVLLTAKQTPEPLAIAQLVRFACAAIAFNSTWQALQTNGWSEPQLAAIQSAWEGCDFVGDMGRAFEVERALTLDFFEQVKRSRTKRAFVLSQRDKTQEMMEGLVEPVPVGGFVRDWLYTPLWRLAWADQDQLRSVNRWGRIIDRERFARTNFLVGLSNQGAKTVQADGEDQELNRYDRLRFLFSNEPFSITDAMIRRVFIAQTEQQMALAAVAIQRYRLHFTTPPPNLGALVPKYLRDLPRDWIDGKPLRYRKLSEEGFVLYSIGEDGKDDGGDPLPSSEKKQYRRLWDGRDAVWPAVASEAEASEHFRRDR